jgi:hypothetical protein
MEEQEKGRVENEVSENELRARLQEYQQDQQNKNKCLMSNRALMANRAIMVLNMGGKPIYFFKSMTEASTCLSLVKNNILDVCRKVNESYGGLIWRFSTSQEEEIGQFEGAVSLEELQLKVERAPVASGNLMPLAERPIIVSSLIGVTLRYYKTMKCASAELGVSNCSILNVCQGRVKTFKGLCWRFATPEEQEEGKVENEVLLEDLKRWIEERQAATVKKTLLSVQGM